MILRFVLFAAVPALLLAGCGDEGDSKQEYIKKGDEICALGTFQIGAEAEKRYDAPQAPPKEAETFAAEVIAPTLRTEVLDKLRDLEPPDGDEEAVTEIYDALEQGITEVENDPAVASEPGFGGTFVEASELAQAYGFSQCGQG